jgi:hypothetical protein
MARKFLTHIDLTGNQIFNAAFEKLATDPTTGNFEGRVYYNTVDGSLKVYHDGTSSWHFVGAITDVQGTTDQVTVSVDGDGIATISLPSNIHVDVTGNLTGNADTATSANYATSAGSASSADHASSADSATNADYATTAGTANAVAANSVNLGTDTNGDYVANLIAGTGIGIDYTSGEGVSPTITNNGVTSISGTADQISVDNSTGDVTVSLPSAVTFPGSINVTTDAVITGNLTVNGTTTTVNSTTVTIADNFVELNSNFTSGSPIANAGISVRRGDDASEQLRWNESSGRWDVGTEGGSFTNIMLVGDPLQDPTINGQMTFDNSSGTAIGYETVNGNNTFRLVAENQLNLRSLNADVVLQADYNHEGPNGNGSSGKVFYGWGRSATNQNLEREVATIGTTQTFSNKTIYSPKLLGPVYVQSGGGAGGLNNTIDADNSTGVLKIGSGYGINISTSSGDIILVPDGSAKVGTDVITTNTASQTLTGKTIDSPVVIGSGVVFEGTTVDEVTTTVSVIDPTANRTINFPDASGTVALLSDITGNAVKVTANVGNGTNTSFAVNHNIGTRDVQVQVYDNSTYETVEVDVVRTDANNVTVSFTVAPSTDAYRVVVIG